MPLLIQRNYFKPFEYPEFYDKMRSQQLVHWLHDKTPMNADIQDWNLNLSEEEKKVIAGILKMFTQSEVVVGDYWSKVGEWFPLPEVNQMTKTFSYFEVIHQNAYALLNDTLGFTDYQAFLQDEAAMNKLELLANKMDTSFSELERYVIKECYNNKQELPGQIKNKIRDVAMSLGIFSAFTEGVILFSSFAVLLSFQMQNKMKGVGQIVSYSIRDEMTHSLGGIYLFNLLCKEYPWLRESIENEMFEAYEQTVRLEHAFIDSVFENISEIPTLAKDDLKEFITNQANQKIVELGYSDRKCFTVNKTAVDKLEWFWYLSSAREFGDFFAVNVTEYSKRSAKPEDLF